MSNFKISVSPSGITAQLNEYREETDVEAMLKFDESQIEDLLTTHAATQSYWEALAVRYRNKFESFTEEFVKKWWAHNKTFSKFVLAGYGELKPTVDAIRDMTILIYSEDTSPVELDKYARIAYKGVAKSKGEYEGTQEEFVSSMFKYLNLETPWYFETVVRMESVYKENYELIKVVAEKLNSRSFHMQDLLKLMMAKRGNIGVSSVDFERKSHNIKREGF